jgi:hypothetical protein
MTDLADVGRISSPASTGGAGTMFEQHVGAYWLALLLVRGIPPILHDCVVEEVHLQTEHLGWHTDDFLIVGETGSSDRRRLAGQVKRKLTVSAKDNEFKKAMQDLWKDFNGCQQFSLSTDRFALVTLRGTNTLLEHFSGLLDCARIARDGADFERLLTTPGFLNAKAVHYCREIQTIIGEAEGRSVCVAQVWPFLRVLHVLSLDLNSATGQTEAMIMTLLAHTAAHEDPLNAAKTSWNALLHEVGEAMPAARSYRRDDLPEVLRQRHSPLGTTEQRALQALSAHSAPILDGIRSTIGRDIHLDRERLVLSVIQQLESTQVVMVSGPAGSGKSSIAKDAINILSADHFAFSFRAEEFAEPHLDRMLQLSQIPCNASALGAILAGQGRKVLLVESVERLLEASTRDAFADLLTLINSDKSWRLLLTCRDYSSDLVRTAFLQGAGVDYYIAAVPPLDDGELEEVKEAYPTLSRPLADVALRRLLRNPYILDKALQISWSEGRPLPQREREFRAVFWEQIVRVEHRVGRAMPRRRDAAFTQIALRRARTLALYAPCSGLDEEAVETLRNDSLIVFSPHSDVLVAPAHDVLEDWALLQWIDEQHAIHEDSIQEFSKAIGTHPAVRRMYRKWVSELVEQDAKAADRMFRTVMDDVELPTYFQDDTLVSILRSSSSAEFLEKHSSELLMNDKQLLRRVIHLLRVACVTTHSRLDKTTAHALLITAPDGPAWVSVLRLVQAHLPSFAQEDRTLLLGLIEDWARGVSWKPPYPEGAESVAAIAHWLLEGFDDYWSDEERKQTLEVIAKIPKADPERFAALLQGGLDDRKEDRLARDFRAIIFEGLEGMPVGRDMPELVVSALNDYLLCSASELQREYGYLSRPTLELLFGIKPQRSFGFFPASAYRGPFLSLLRHHPRQGLDLIISILNHSADWYAHPRVRSDCVEPPFEIALTFADGTSRTQWCNARLWNLYRGTSVGPYVLQSLLMALELWLLEFAKAYPDALDAMLLQILKRSDSVALTAVVASVATGFPHSSGETLLALLRSPVCILLDRSRRANEPQVPSRMLALMPRVNVEDEVYEQEREEADARPHRHQDLETAIISVQFGPLASRVHETLDRHRADMPPVGEQDENDRVWRLAIHRMDLRQYTIAEEATEADVVPGIQVSPADGRQYVHLDPREPEPDVKDMVEQSVAQFQVVSARLGLLTWGLKVFGHEEDATYDPAQWRQKLQEARTAGVSDDGGEDHDLGRSGSGFVAAVCVRDHWEEMTGDERNWCVNAVCLEVGRSSDSWNQPARLQSNGMEADRICACVLPLLLGKSLDEISCSRVRQLLVVALTHATNEVRWYAASGVGDYLWQIDRELVLRCVDALAAGAMLVQQAADSETSRPYHQRRPIDDVEAEVASAIQRRFFEPDGIPVDAHRAFDPTGWFGAEADKLILRILGYAPTEAVTIAAFERFASILVEWWDEDGSRLQGRQKGHPQRNCKAQSVMTELLEDFLLRTTAVNAAEVIAPIADAVDNHPDKVRWLLIGLISVEERQQNTAQFWLLWKMLAEKVRNAIWLAWIDNEYPGGAEMILAIFLVTWWKDGVRHWRSLEGHAEHIHALFEDLPACSEVLDAYVRFLYHIGEQSLPTAFVRVAMRLKQGEPMKMLTKRNTVFLLEALLQRYVYGRPLELKSKRDLREAVLFLLDLLVENGSSAAFRMRDDFVTSASLT